MLEMDEATEGWIINTVRKHYWRVAAWYDFDDLVQEGYMKYYHVTNHMYPDITNRRHIMSLFKVAFLNRINILAKNITKQSEVGVEDLAAPFRDAVDSPWDVVGDMATDPEQELNTLMDMPAELRKVLGLFNDPGMLRRLRSPYRVRLDGTRETLNERLCRLVGMDSSKANLAVALRSYLQAA